MKDEPPFDAALERFLQGEPEPDDGIELATAMAQDPAATELVRKLLVIDDLLRQQAQPDEDAFVDSLVLRLNSQRDDAFVDRIASAARPARPRALVFGLALAAVALLLAAVAALWLPWQREVEVVNTSPSAPVPAPVVRPAVAPMPSSDTMVQVETGQQGYQLPSGVAVNVAGPASLRFVDDMFVDLQHGRVSADAGATTRGFTVQTAQARVVDLGTRFGVQAAGDQTEVAVFEGTVRVESRLTATMLTLRAGEALAVGSQGAMTRLTGLVTGERWQDWSVQTSSVLRQVATSGRSDAFCRIVPRGFKAGALVYAGAPLRWEATGDMPFPKGLTGADLIQAPQHGLRDKDWSMKVTLGAPATLYVFSSKSAPPPAWLTAQFTLSGQQVAATERVAPANGKPARLQMKAVFDVWKRVVRQPGTLVLGPPSVQKDGKPTAMYGVAAQLLH